MPRTESRTKVAIWADGEFRARTCRAQRMYWLLYSQPTITLCGVLALTEKRWAALAADETLESVQAALAELEQAEFIVIDRDTEEVLVRTFAKHDGVARSPKTRAAAWQQLGAIASPTIRAVAEAELAKLDTVPDTPSDTPCHTPSDRASAGRGGRKARNGTPTPPPEPAKDQVDRVSGTVSDTPSGRASDTPSDRTRGRARAASSSSSFSSSVSAPTASSAQPPASGRRDDDDDSKANPDQLAKLIDETVAVIVDRRTATVRPDNPAAYRRTVTRQVRTEHETEISKLLEDGRTVLQVADRVEPPDPAELERRVQIRRQQLADLHAQGRFECDRCQDHGTVEVHDDAGKYIGQARCPQCNTKGND